MSNKSYQFKLQVMKDNQGGETKVMKKILSIALSTAMAFSMFASVAFGADAKLTTEDKYKALKEAGVFDGYTDGSAGLDQKMTRAQFAKIVAKVLSLEEDKAAASVYADIKDNNWAAGFIGAVTKAGLMEGSNSAKYKGKKAFGYTDDVTVEQLAKVLVLALKLEVPASSDVNASAWAKGYVAAAVKAGLIPADATFKAPALRSLLVDAAYQAREIIETSKITYEVKIIDANNIEVTFSDAKDKPEKVKLEKALEANKETVVKVPHNGKEFDVKVNYVITAATKIQSVSADNLKEIVVKFDGDIDEASATAKYNYTLDGFTIDSITLAADKKSVTLLLENGLVNTLNQQKEYDLVVKGVKNSDKSKTFDDKIKFKPVDVTLPVVKEVVGLGTKAFKVVFSEPVKDTTVNTSSNFNVDGKIVSGSVKFSYPNIAIVSTELAIGEHKLTVSNVEDFAGFKVLPQEMSFSVAEDKLAPEVVSAKTKDLRKVEIEFNETIKSVSKAYHTSTSRDAKKITIKDNKVTVEFDKEKQLSLGENTIYLEGVSDYSNNSANREAKVTPELDNERPTVVYVKAESTDSDSKHKITFQFSKDVEDADVKKKENITLKDKDGKVVNGRGFQDGHPVSPPKAIDGTKKYEITTFSKLDSGKYTLEISGIRDMAAVANTMVPYTTTIDINDANRPVISSAWYKQTPVGLKYETEIYVQYDKPMAVDGSGNVRDINKYNYSKTVGSATYLPMPNNSTIDMVDDKTVRITLPRSEDSKIVENPDSDVFGLRITNVADTKGNFISGSLQTTNVEAYKNLKIRVEKAEATDKDTVKVTFNKLLTNVNASDFYAANKALTVSSEDTKDGKSVVTFKTADGSKPFGADPSNQAFEVRTSNSQNAFGIPVQTGSINLIDKIAPEIKKGSMKVVKSRSVADAVYYNLTVTFDEPLIVTDNKSAFTVRVKGDDSKGVSNVTPVNGLDTFTIEFWVKNAISVGETVEFYLQSHNVDSKIVTDINGNAAKSTSDTVVYDGK